MDINLNTVSTAEEEKKLEAGDGSQCSYVGGQKRQCESEIMFQTTNIESVPDEILFDILLRLPAQDIHVAASLVSPKWQQMIRTRGFVRAYNLQHSTLGLLIQPRCCPNNTTDRPIFVATRKGRIEISIFDNEFTIEVLSSCNGLTLEQRRDEERNDYPFVTNRATKQHFALPPFLKRRTTFGAAIAYAAAAMEYKVVHVHMPSSDSLVCGILTVGVDKDWTRCGNTQHVSPTNKWLLSQPPLATQGFLHWTPIKDYFEYVLSLNVETEIITQFRCPSCLCQGLRYRYLPMGSYLSLLIAHVGFSWDEVWEMKPETGEWAMVASINLEAQKFRFEGELVSASNCRLCPVGWLKLREVLLFRVFIASSSSRFTRSFIAYDVRTQEVDSFELENEGRKSYTLHRNNTLAWLDGSWMP